MNPTASGLEAASHCPASLIFPQSRSTDPDAEDGHEVHGFASDVIGGMHPVEALAKRPAHLHKRLANLRLSDLVGDLTDGIRSEVAYALNTETDEVRELGIAIDRDYPDLGPEWIVGTLDIEGRRLDDRWVVKDLKSGMADVTPASVNFQLLFFSRVLWLLHGKEVVAEIVRVRQDGTAHVETSATFRPLDLDAFGDKLIEILGEVAKVRQVFTATGQAWTNEGSHCRYCAAFASCPAKNMLARRLVPELEQLRDQVATLTPEDAGKAWGKLKQIGQIYDVIEKVLKERAKLEPLPSKPGFWVRQIRYEKETFDQAAAMAMLRAKGATDAELATLRVSKAVEQIREVKRNAR